MQVLGAHFEGAMFKTTKKYIDDTAQDIRKGAVTNRDQILTACKDSRELSNRHQEFAEHQLKNVAEESKKGLQSIASMIQLLCDELQSLRKDIGFVATEESPSKRASDLQQKLLDYQRQLDGLAGQVIDGELPQPPRV